MHKTHMDVCVYPHVQNVERTHCGGLEVTAND